MQHDASLLRLNGLDVLVSRETFAKVDNALGQANLPEPLIAFILGDVLSGSTRGSPSASATLLVEGIDRGVVDNLVIEGVIGVA